MNRAVFLDRDGVVIEDPGYLTDPEGVVLLPGVLEALARLRADGWRLVVVSNQSGIARGMLTEERLAEIQARLAELLAAGGVTLDGIYYCPHHPQGNVAAYRRECDCRKPAPGMLLQASRDLDLDITSSWMVGDKYSDAAAGRAAGCRTILVGSSPPDAPEGTLPDYRAASLKEAADIISAGCTTRAR